MRRLALISSLLLTFLTPARARAADDRSANANWWTKRYGELDSGSALARKAQEIFRRVTDVADQRGIAPPSLYLVDTARDPYAAALPDGNVILNRSVLSLCYGPGAFRQGARFSAIGDARLAFVLGHELSHLNHDNYWHAFAAPARREAGEDGPGPAPGEGYSTEVEDQADANAFLYTLLAGYDPTLLLEKDRSFFDRWVQHHETPGLDGDTTHSKPKARARQIEALRRKTAEKIPFFNWGVRLYELGRYAKALPLLEEFDRVVPAREVNNALGLVHYQLGTAALARCDGRLVTRFQLPIVLDPETLAERTRKRGGGTESPCRGNELFRSEAEHAVRYLERASESDKKYLPALLNLAAAQLLKNETAGALATATAAEKLAPDDPRVAAYYGVALYLYGEETGFDSLERALDRLGTALQRHPEAAPYLRFDRARILSERKRTAEAKEEWERTLSAEADGPWADVVRERLGRTDPRGKTAARTRARPTAPPLPLGSAPPKKGGWQREKIRLVDFRGATLEGPRHRAHGSTLEEPQLRALEIGSTIQVVERDLESGPPAVDLIGVFGPPLRRVPTVAGEVLVFDGVAWELRDGRAVTQIWFVTGSGKGPSGSR